MTIARKNGLEQPNAQLQTSCSPTGRSLTILHWKPTTKITNKGQNRLHMGKTHFQLVYNHLLFAV